VNNARLVGEPCQAVRPDRARVRIDGVELYCGKPARFMWYGLDPRRLHLTVAQRKKYIRACVLMCADCAKDLLDDIGWEIKDGRGRLERLSTVKQRTHCRACGVDLWVAWGGEGPATNPGEFRFCPRCGERSHFAVDADKDYWEVMAEDLSIKGVEFPVQLIKMFHEDWTAQWARADRRHRTFYDYVKHQSEVFERTGEFEV
jgi:hypothetical protein